MKLTELQAEFIKLSDPETGSNVPVDTLKEAQGIRFLCPLCYRKNKGTKGTKGTHSVVCWFVDRGVPAHIEPGPGRWNPQGTGLADLSFVPGPKSRSVKLTSGCMWHGLVINGETN